MNLVSRINKLQRAIKPTEKKITFIGWADCKWRECEGLIRGETESIDDFKKRVMKVTSKKFIWCQ